MNAFETTVRADAATTETAVRDALGAQGFGVVSEIDVAANLKNVLGVERPPLKILGACSPALVQQALAIDSSIALLLPCNVVLDQADGGTRSASSTHKRSWTTPASRTSLEMRPRACAPPSQASTGSE